MTNKEAMKWIDPYESAYKKQEVLSNGENPMAYIDESIELSIKALEKQVPKKINIEQWMDTKCDCGYVFSQHYEDGYYSIPRHNKTKYCPNCGQRIDWR